MPTTIAPITLGSGLFSVNAYLITGDDGFVLVDTGMRSHRTKIRQALADLGCTPGSLRLIAITHGDFDHIGNVAYLAEEFGAPVAMHQGDLRMASDGDMFAGRHASGAVRTLLGLFVRLRPTDRFGPDVLLDEASNLAEYGLPGVTVLHLGAHSAGSIALRFPDGRVICGDVLENRGVPRIGSIMDDVPAAEAAARRLRSLGTTTVYPGHGRPFELSELLLAGTKADTG